VRIGDQVHVGAGDATGIGGQDDGAVHLGQLRQALGRELGVEQESAAANREHFRTVADHDERAHVRLEDPIQTLPQRPAGRHTRQRLGHGDTSPGGHDWILVVGSALQTGDCDCLCDRVDLQQLNACDIVGRRHGNDGPFEAEARRFLEAPAELADLSHLPGEPDLAADDDVVGDGPIAMRRHESEDDSEVGGRFADPHAANR